MEWAFWHPHFGLSATVLTSGRRPRPSRRDFPGGSKRRFGGASFNRSDCLFSGSRNPLQSSLGLLERGTTRSNRAAGHHFTGAGTGKIGRLVQVVVTSRELGAARPFRASETTFLRAGEATRPRSEATTWQLPSWKRPFVAGSDLIDGDQSLFAEPRLQLDLTPKVPRSLAG